MPALVKWKSDHWTPIRIEKIYQEDSWFVLKCKQLSDERLVRALAPQNPGDLRDVPAVIGNWSDDGFAVLSYLDDHGLPYELTVCRYSDYCLLEPSLVDFPIMAELQN